MSRWIPLGVAALIILGLLLGRVIWSSRAELLTGQEAFQRGDGQAAVLHLGRAAHWYAPGNPYVVEALEDLRRIGRQAEMEGELDLALMAYRTIRRSCLGTRSFYTPHVDRLDEANRRIASLMARQEPPPLDRGKTVAQRRDEHLALLQDVEQPHPFWSLLATLSFLVWIAGAFAFIMKAFDGDLSLKRRPAMIWGGVVAGGVVVWAVSLLLA